MAGDDGHRVLSATDVGHLSPGERAELSALLDRYAVPHDLVGSELRADAAETETVQQLLDIVTSPTARDADLPSLPPGIRLPPGPHVGPSVAPRWRRLLAFLLESYLLAALGLGLARVLSASGAWIVVLGLLVANGVVLVATTGRTVGMQVLDVRIVDATDGRSPGWLRSTVRFGVLAGPGVILTALGPLAGPALDQLLRGVANLWLVVCVAPILVDPYRRGLHDRAAGTLVVGARSPDPA
ncbi:MAG: RDD family protein [Acidimicrobiales bacterium]|nr:RDD family protein [Acidimicrobiales bacterium]